MTPRVKAVRQHKRNMYKHVKRYNRKTGKVPAKMGRNKGTDKSATSHKEAGSI